MRYNISRHNADRVIGLPDADIAARYVEGATIAELAAAHGVSSPTIAKALQRTGTERRPAKQRPGHMTGDKNPSWSGGRRQRSDGYWIVWTPDGERLEHRVIVEREIGRALSDDEIVHHLDGDRSNNDPPNLAIMTQAQHATLHAPELLAKRNGHRGSSNPRAKLTDDEVGFIRSSQSSGRSIAATLGVHPSTVHRIRNGSGWL